MTSEIVEKWNIVWNSRKPVICQVHGYCLAGGTDLALNTDIIICAEDAQFGYPPVRAMGSPPSHMWTYFGRASVGKVPAAYRKLYRW